MMGGMTPPPEHPGEVALLSCGDVVTAWDEPRRSELHPEILMVPCVACGGKWRVVTVVLPAGALIATGAEARARAQEIGEVPFWRSVEWVAARPDGTVEFGYSGKRAPFVLPAIAPVS